ncbi:MAG: DnaJ domain-containing protein [SAR324 cluster bacterium]|nr:DnaJ domain-containing protein [SAR324 cluster bacterium]
MLILIPLTVLAKPLKYITKSSSFSTPHPITAVEISSDEALIAVAMKMPPSDSLIQIYDRQNRKPVTQIISEGKQVEQLVFDHYTRQLAIVSPQHIQLWNLDQFSPQADQSLSKKNLIKEITYKSETASTIHFSKNTNALMWIENNQIQKLELDEQDHEKTSLWIGEHSTPPQSFSLDTNEEWIAVSLINSKNIILANPRQKRVKPKLDYHHFPVTQVHFIQPEIVLSLDKERNLIWGHVNSRTKVRGGPLQNISAQEVTLAVYPILQDKFLAVLTQQISDSNYFAHLTDESGALLHTLPIVNLNGFAVSPTGAYVLNASTSHQINIHQLRYHQKPSDYIRDLNKKGASELARHYQNHLEQIPTNLSGNHPSGLTLQSLIANLKTVITNEDWTEVDQLVKQILKYDPKNSIALDAVQLLKDHHYLVLLENGKQEFEDNKLKKAIRTLVQIPKNSQYRTEARDLIELAEKQNQLALSLEKVENEIYLQNWAKAKALLVPILQQHPDHSEAQALSKKLEEQEAVSFFWDTFTTIIMIGALGSVGFFVFRQRDQLVDWLSLKEKESPSLKPPLKARKSTGSNINPQEKQLFLETLEKTKSVLRLSKEADKSRKYVAQLIDFEAEIAVIHKKGNSPDANYKQLTKQLFHILQTIRSFNFTSETHKQQKPRTEKKQESANSQTRPTPKAQPDYYEILGVPQTASPEVIKQAYHQRMKAYHPDLHQSSEFDWIKEQAEAKTRDIRTAYEILKNKQSRQEYDKNINIQN